MSEVVPEGWEDTDIGQVVSEIADGGTPATSNPEYFGGRIPWVVIDDIQPRIHTTRTSITDLGLSKSSAKLWEKGTIILSTGATIGRVGIAMNAMATKQGICGVVPNNDVDTDYFYHLLVSKERQLNILSQGSTIKETRPPTIKQIRISLPPLPEQKKIASILTSVDEVIEKTQSQINKLQDLKKGTMNELLTKGIGHTEFKDSELGRIPKSWEVGRVSDYSSLVTNGFVGSAAQHYRETGIPYLVSKNIRDNFIDERGLTYISKEFHEKTAKSQLRTGDLLTVQSGHVGSTSVVPQKFDGANCHALILTRFDQTLIDAEFVAYYFNSQSGRVRLSDYFVGSTIVHLNTSDLKKFTIPIPELREQKEIIQIVQSIEVQVALWEEKLHQTQSLKKSLMQDLLTGKVRVSVN
jgi:type I restriction enzyme, S subunit